MPYQLAFMDDGWFIIEKESPFLIIQFVVDGFLLLDVLLTFLLAITNYYGSLITSWKDIAKTYITTWFIFDVFTALPYSFMTIERPEDQLQSLSTGLMRAMLFLRVFKIFRIKKFKPLYSVLAYKSRLSSQFLKTAIGLASFFILIHLMACLYHLIVKHLNIRLILRSQYPLE